MHFNVEPIGHLIVLQRKSRLGMSMYQWMSSPVLGDAGSFRIPQAGASQQDTDHPSPMGPPTSSRLVGQVVGPRVPGPSEMRRGDIMFKSWKSPGRKSVES